MSGSSGSDRGRGVVLATQADTGILNHSKQTTMGKQLSQTAAGVTPYIPVEIMMMGKFAAPPEPKLSAGWQQLDGRLVYRWRRPLV